MCSASATAGSPARAARGARRGRPRARSGAATMSGRCAGGPRPGRAYTSGVDNPASSTTHHPVEAAPWPAPDSDWSPAARARPRSPPIRANRTSAPSRAARLVQLGSAPSSAPYSASHATRAAAASAEPPPVPPATGTCLTIVEVHAAVVVDALCARASCRPQRRGCGRPPGRRGHVHRARDGHGERRMPGVAQTSSNSVPPDTPRRRRGSRPAARRRPRRRG